MKALFSLITLSIIVLICFLSGKFYINGEYLISSALVLTWFASIIGWINYVGLQLQKPRV